MKEWLARLQVGDNVYITQNYGQDPLFAKVKRFTRTQIMVSTINDRSDSWATQYLIKPSPEIKEKIEIRALKNKVNALRGKLGTPNDRPTLEAMIVALTPFVK
jgi:hypothetical protein